MKYKVLFSRVSIEELEVEINLFLVDGWKPQGGFSMSYSADSGAAFYQAMVKERDQGQGGR